MKNRCAWVPEKDILYTKYHDEEWGIPVHDDRLLFEFLLLEGFQAGLSWRTILYKRENFSRAFDGFNPQKIANYDGRKIEELLSDTGIIRNRQKIHASIKNAQEFLKIQREFNSFDNYCWQFIGGKPLQNKWKLVTEIPARTDQSDALSKDLLRRGFKFVGSTIIYAHMQATGMVNDHTIDCFRYQEILSLANEY
jgi:DNA-3-methyladenine glycosylase I